MDSLLTIWFAHRTSITLAAAYLFAVIAGAQPPLKPDAGYYKVWAYKVFQGLAANFEKKEKL